MQTRSIPLLAFALSWLCLCSTRENIHLFYYETLSNISVTTIAKRSSAWNASLVKELRFQAFMRKFHLHLTSGSPVLAETFRARMIHRDGSSTWFNVDQGKLFTGHVMHSPESMVNAHLADGLWHIHILEAGEAYAVEPAWMLLGHGDNPLNHSLVTYRLSDLKDLPAGYRFCSAPENPNLNTPRSANPPSGWAKHKQSSWGMNKGRFASLRVKRESKRDTCVINIVGDTHFYNHRCKRNYKLCSSLMITSLQWVDTTYQASPFENADGTSHTYGVGLQIGELRIHMDFTQESGSTVHFNQDRQFSAVTKLEAFSRAMTNRQKQHCLHHLFTCYVDKGSSLGRAFTNSMCKLKPVSPNNYVMNTGVSSACNSVGHIVPTLMSNFILSHEIGHNFGAEHDPDTPKCGPSEEQGGKFIMWPYTNSGYRPNNFFFSKCSLRQIGTNIPGSCFQDRSKLTGFCGNGIVDPSEECDAGYIGLQGFDPCCLSSCVLRESAKCSQANEECCENCRIAPAGKVCRVLGYINTCIKNSHCTGHSALCSPGESVPDGQSCASQHECHNGSCVGPCEIATLNSDNHRTYLPCSCNHNDSALCMHCCYDATVSDNPGECRPFADEHRPDGSPCEGGICTKGACLKNRGFSIARLEAYIEFVHKSTWGQVMRGNIVVIVVVLSLIVWVPASLKINSLDGENRLDFERLMQAIRFQQELEDLRGRFYAKRSDECAQQAAEAMMRTSAQMRGSLVDSPMVDQIVESISSTNYSSSVIESL
ncbi:hypothetical protein EGW08_021469 [Elysia chlorotica]|uniref:Peptidase M12B domain-containing protein n=1 Tax=Elysia chlorotica TaxID=188477 RepID=A0A433SNF0_ELYCH|nr:hypothetical protein EGW08_021469 [Elysia chlorotica]